MSPQRRITNAFEEDALTGWRRAYRWRPGQRAWVKRLANHRERREARREIEQQREGR